MKVTIQGKTCTCTSVLSVEDLLLVQKYRPEELVTTDEDGNELFSVKCGKTTSMNANGICFAKDVSGMAYVSFPIPDDMDAEAAKDYAADMLAPCHRYINILEGTLPGVISNIKTQRENQMQNIEVL